MVIKDCSYEVSWLGGLAHLGEMIFILRPCAIFCLTSVKNKIVLIS